MASTADSNGWTENSSLEPIAICGMACRLPGNVNSASDFWSLLVEKRSGQTSKVPTSRFNIDAHYHEVLERPGSFNVMGGYFLHGDPADFDPSFFNMTPMEAQWLDPQQRKMLEVTFEALQSAGLTLDTVAGSNTAVFVGSFTSDYQQMSIRDPDFRHNYAATGVDPGIISNRIGNIFNLKGPSFTINTACSSSIYALHYACHALRSRDCDAAIVGGVNLILTVDQHMNTAKLGILSPTSTCHTFDASADGYGRAEGAGALYIKRLSDAIRDGDPIRSVIRSTAVNTNGKVEGMGITHPSAEGQERVVRIAYERAGLRPENTAYAELHGTGTPVGDPIEVRAIAKALNDNRPKNKPLLVGAVKPNIGHSEAASGIFAIMKASMMTEAAMIPGVAYFEKLNPNILESEWNVRVHSDTAPWPSDFPRRRVSVSSFGYGGTNGHVVIENVHTLHPGYEHAKPKKDAAHDRSSKKPYLLTFAAHDNKTLAQNVQSIAGVASDYYLADLAHTLNLHRTRFAKRAFTVVHEGKETEAFTSDAIQTGNATKGQSSVGFLFTGQGAQWAGMGRHALKEFPTFKNAIRKLDMVLDRCPAKTNFGIEDCLLDDSALVSQTIDSADVAQPLCTAIQIALVDLFASWGITPVVNIGHSSGEIGASYAAGLLSAPEAIIAAFCRGRAVVDRSTPGSMLAVGVGKEEVEHILAAAGHDVVIACENSPSSITISGNTKSIARLLNAFTTEGIFARELRTGRAYHSPQMAPVGDLYDRLLSDALEVLDDDDRAWRRPRSQMISTVTGESVPGDSLPEGYFSANLRKRVLFDTAVQEMCRIPQLSQVSLMVEIGPHSALSGPFKQICMAQKLDKMSYVPSFVRNKDDAMQLLSVAGSLYVYGYPVDLEAVNSISPQRAVARKPRTQSLLVDLPPYQWNYEKRYWAEPRGSTEQRARVYPRHDLLGSAIAGLSDQTRIWRNILRHKDVPWLRDHSLGGSAIFPAAGHLSLAIEALRQVTEAKDETVQGVVLRDVDIRTALVIPDSDDGVEVISHLHSPTNGSSWYTFDVQTLVDGRWNVHCEGRISTTPGPGSPAGDRSTDVELTHRTSGKQWYDAFERVGFHYGKAFQQLQDIRTHPKYHDAEAKVGIKASSGAMAGESRYLLHPGTIDACLQLIIISIHAGKYKDMPWGVVPTHIEEMSIFAAGSATLSKGEALASADKLGNRSFNTDVRLLSEHGRTLLDINNLRCVTYDAALPLDALEYKIPAQPYSVSEWGPDIATLKTAPFAETWPSLAQIGKMVELIDHRRPINSVVCFRPLSAKTIDTVLEALPSDTEIVVAVFTDDLPLVLSESAEARASVKAISRNPQQWTSTLNADHDLLILDDYIAQDEGAFENFVPLVRNNGWVIGHAKAVEVWPASARQMGELMVLRNSQEYMNGHHDGKTAITILVTPEDSLRDEVVSLFGAAAAKINARQASILEFTPGNDDHIVINDTRGTLLSSMLDDPRVFEAIRAVLSSTASIVWLTRGVRSGRSSKAGMAEGFLRTVRAEQASVRVMLLDVDVESTSDDVGDAILDKLRTACTRDSGEDTEFWLHEGCLHISRVYPNRVLNASEGKSQQEVVLQDGMRLKMVNGAFEHVGEAESPRHSIEVQTLAAGSAINASDHTIVCGKVISTAPLIDQDIVGKTVVAVANNGTRTSYWCEEFEAIDESTNVTAASLVATLIPLHPLVYLLLARAKMQEGDALLILPAPVNVLEMAKRLADALRWDYDIITHSAKDKEQCVLQFGIAASRIMLSTDAKAIAEMRRRQRQKPINVLAHDFSPFSREIWRSCHAPDKFLLLDASLDVAPNPVPFRRGASFIVSDYAVTKGEPAMKEALTKAVQLISAYPKLLEAMPSTQIIDVEQAMSTDLQSDRAVAPNVLCFGYGKSTIQVSSASVSPSLSQDAFYLLVGCLGGLGRSVSRRMMELGARRFAFVSRSGAEKPEAAGIIRSLNDAGATTKVYNADVSDETALRQIVTELVREAPIRGVIHAAMVLKDGIFEHMTHESFKSCVVPKAIGALSLNNAVQDLDLDFFIMTSSISAVVGNTGQSNYSAANSVLDNLAVSRRTAGRAATSLALPMVLGVGVVAENEDLAISLGRKGLYGIDEQEMLQSFEAAMKGSACNAHVLMGIETRELAKCAGSFENTQWYADARFRHVRAGIEAREVLPRGDDRDDLASLIRAAEGGGSEQLLNVIALHIAKRMSRILMIPLEDFELDGPSMASYGLDSMIGVEMRTWLFKEFGLDIPFQDLLAPALTFTKLAKVVAEKAGLLEVEA